MPLLLLSTGDGDDGGGNWDCNSSQGSRYNSIVRRYSDPVRGGNTHSSTRSACESRWQPRPPERTGPSACSSGWGSPISTATTTMFLKSTA